MMDELLRIASELRLGLLDILSGPIADGRIQGALLEVDRYWYFSAVRRFQPWGIPWIEWLEPRGNIVRSVQVHTVFDRLPLDWTYRPWDWPQYCKLMGYLFGSEEAPSPILIRVLMRDPTERSHPGLQSSKFPTIVTESAALSTRYAEYRITYDLRPSAVATSMMAGLFEKLPTRMRRAKQPHSFPGSSIGRADPNTAGTAGGYLRDPLSGNNYVVSCAHVLGPCGTDVFSPGPFEGRDGKVLGTVRFGSISPVKLSSEACSLHTAPNAGRLDISIAEVPQNGFDNSFATHRVRGIGQIHRFQRVTFRGKESGIVAAQVNAATIWQEIYTADFGDGPSGFRCFGDIFELASIKGDVAPIALEGDSGAWIVDEAGGLRSWNGVLIAQQGTRAYGCFAEHILDAVRMDAAFPNGLAFPDTVI